MPSDLPASVVERLARLASDQRAAATAPPGPVLCVAPAGSGKTTTLVARIAWLVATGAAPDAICAVTFNKRAADELTLRVDSALEPLGLAPGSVRVKTFHALGREILGDAGVSVDPLLDREAVLRDLWPDITRTAIRRLDDAFSRLKLDLGVTAEQVATDPDPGPIARAFLAYEGALADAGGLDFDDLVGRALRTLESNHRLLERWRTRTEHLLVDETQDVDRSQLRLALLLAAPSNRIFLVGDDDQTIYGWRLADVRRILALAESLPGLRRLDLTVNYRCPAVVVERAVRLVSCNEERFAKSIAAAPNSPGSLVLAPDASDETARIRHVLGSWPDDGGSRAILARTNAELVPAAAVALEAGIPFAAPKLRLLTEDPRLPALLADAEAFAEGVGGEDVPLLRLLAGYARATLASTDDPDWPVQRRERAARSEERGGREDAPTNEDEPLPLSGRDLLAAVVSWAPPYATVAALAAAIDSQRARIAELRRDDAQLTLATAHSTKGLEFDHVAVIGLDEGRFPSARSLADSTEPDRAMQEERRLAYVAWTRARRSLTLVFDPDAPSPFLREAFDPVELAPIPGSTASGPR